MNKNNRTVLILLGIFFILNFLLSAGFASAFGWENVNSITVRRLPISLPPTDTVVFPQTVDMCWNMGNAGSIGPGWHEWDGSQFEFRISADSTPVNYTFYFNGVDVSSEFNCGGYDANITPYHVFPFKDISGGLYTYTFSDFLYRVTGNVPGAYPFNVSMQSGNDTIWLNMVINMFNSHPDIVPITSGGFNASKNGWQGGQFLINGVAHNDGDNVSINSNEALTIESRFDSTHVFTWTQITDWSLPQVYPDWGIIFSDYKDFYGNNLIYSKTFPEYNMNISRNKFYVVQGVRDACNYKVQARGVNLNVNNVGGPTVYVNSCGIKGYSDTKYIINSNIDMSATTWSNPCISFDTNVSNVDISCSDMKPITFASQNILVNINGWWYPIQKYNNISIHNCNFIAPAPNNNSYILFAGGGWQMPFALSLNGIHMYNINASGFNESLVIIQGEAGNGFTDSFNDITFNNVNGKFGALLTLTNQIVLTNGVVSNSNYAYFKNYSIKGIDYTGNGNSGGQNVVGVFKFSNVNAAYGGCTESWMPQLQPARCTSGTQFLTYTDFSKCGTTNTLPKNNGTTQNCCVESWAQYLNPSRCKTGTQEVLYTDRNNCSTTYFLPANNGTLQKCSVCNENWVRKLTPAKCTTGAQLITYTDAKNCGTTDYLPIDNGTTQTCCMESWIKYFNPTICSNGVQTILYKDNNNCGTTVLLPANNGTTKTCCVENWSPYLNPKTCVSGTQQLLYKDLNRCGTTLARPANYGTTKTCCVENWVKYLLPSTCTTGKQQTLYADVNSCGTTDYLPKNNGTIQSCKKVK